MQSLPQKKVFGRECSLIQTKVIFVLLMVFVLILENVEVYGAITFFGVLFQTTWTLHFLQNKGLIRVRSPLLTESRLIFFPLVTEMFQFTR